MITKKAKIYNLSPVSGEALLNFKGRLSADDLYMQLYDIDENKGELVNINTENADKDGLVFDGDCLSTCAYLKDHNIQVDLIYIDPPFASAASYSKKIYLKNKTTLKKDYSLELAENSIGEEIMYGDIWNKEDYLNWLYVRLLAMREILSDDGAIYVHLDWHIGSYVKVLLDEVFGEENFRNEIIWSYRSGGASKKESLARKHDVIYFYSKSTSFVINEKKERQYLEKPFMDSKQDAEGRYYVDTLLRDVLEGIITIVNPDGTLTEYNVRPVLNFSNERTDYNTQKPEGLLKLLIDIASNEGDIVADFFGGSGTTARAAYTANRKFITCDIGVNSIQTIRDTLKEKNAKFEIIDIKDGLDLFRNPTQTMNQIFKLCSGEPRTSTSEYSTLWNGTIPFNKKMQYAKILDNRKILDKNYLDFLLTEIAEDFINDSQDEYIILYIYKDDAINQAYINAKIKEKGFDFKINLIPIEEILKERQNQINIPDSARLSLTKKGSKYCIEILNYFSPYLQKKITEENLRRVNKKQKQIELSENGYELIEMVSIDTSLKNKWTSNYEEKAGLNEQISGKYKLDTDKFRIKIRNIAGDEIVIASEDIHHE